MVSGEEAVVLFGKAVKLGDARHPRFEASGYEISRCLPDL